MENQASNGRPVIPPEVHRKAAAVARTLMRMPPKPIKSVKASKGDKSKK